MVSFSSSLSSSTSSSEPTQSQDGYSSEKLNKEIHVVKLAIERCRGQSVGSASYGLDVGDGEGVAICMPGERLKVEEGRGAVRFGEKEKLPLGPGF